MKTSNSLTRIVRNTVAIAFCVTVLGCSDSGSDSDSAATPAAAPAPIPTRASPVAPEVVPEVVTGSLGPTVDDFSDATNSSLGIKRQFFDDSTTGGQTNTQHSVKEGVLFMKGQISPPRGQPGWASVVLLLDPAVLPEDISVYAGIRLLVRVNKGRLSLSANSSEITNFDYHAAPVAPPSDGKFHEVTIPFVEMKRAWSAQTKLNTGTLTGLSLVAVGLQKGAFDFEVDEVGFYKKQS